jgi:hypothetical protein
LNSLDVDLQLFETILSFPFFLQTPMILFLNKLDLLQQKVTNGVPFQSYFPDFEDFQPEPAPAPHTKVKTDRGGIIMGVWYSVARARHARPFYDMRASHP